MRGKGSWGPAWVHGGERGVLWGLSMGGIPGILKDSVVLKLEGLSV